MDGVKWFKMFVGFHNNRKIKQLKRLPNGAEYVCAWVYLLDLAASTNDDGLVYFTKEMPYTEEMLAAEFDMPLQTIRQAMQLFEKFGMIEVVDDLTQISNWSRYQNVESLESVREKTRLRTRAWRERKRLETLANNAEMSDKSEDVTSHETSLSHESDGLEERKEKEEERKEKGEGRKEENEAQRASSRTKEPRHQYGEYKNVLLSDTELEKLKTEFPDDYEKRIDDLSYYMKRTGRSYKDHLAAIRSWARSDAKKAGGGSGRSPQRGSAEDLQNSYDMLAKWAAKETEG